MEGGGLQKERKRRRGVCPHGTSCVMGELGSRPLDEEYVLTDSKAIWNPKSHYKIVCHSAELNGTGKSSAFLAEAKIVVSFPLSPGKLVLGCRPHLWREDPDGFWCLLCPPGLGTMSEIRDQNGALPRKSLPVFVHVVLLRSILWNCRTLTNNDIDST